MLSLSSADSALKDVYLDVLTNQLNNNLDPFFAKIQQTTQDVSGNEVHKMLPLGINGGIGAGSEIGILPKPKENNYAVLISKLKNLYGRIEITDKAIRASKDEAGSFLNLLNAEMENLIESSKFNFRRMLYGNGSAKLGTVENVDVDSNVYSVTGLGNFMVGMRICGYFEGAEVVGFNNVKVIDIDYDNGTIILDKALPLAAEDKMFMDFYLCGSKDKEIVGIEGICDAAAVPNLYGIDRTTVSYMTPTKSTIAKADFKLSKLMQIVDNIRLKYNGNVDFIASGYAARRNYMELIKSSTVNTDVMTLNGGFTTISFCGIPILASNFCEDKNMYFLDSTGFHIHQLCDWTWLENNKGQILRQREGYPIHSATLVKYCDMICDRPNRIHKLTITG